MEITCRKCGTTLVVTNPATPIIKCTNCNYPNPVMAGAARPTAATETPPPPASPPPVARPRRETESPGLASPPPAAPLPSRPSPDRQTGPGDLGWLVVHDEYADQQTHPLHIGRQVVGRKSLSRPCDIMIETDDPYMGRNHCIIEVKPSRSGGFDYFLSDVKMTNGIAEQMSTNGTFVNAYPTPLKPKDMVYLKDGDTIQMGKTKVVIKTLITATNAQDASRIVQETDYSPTVILQ